MTSKTYLIIIIGLIIFVSLIQISTIDIPKPLPQQHWYGEYCYANNGDCTYMDGEGDRCPVQVDDRDIISDAQMRLKDGSCKVE